jgi:hypothetical protein
VRDLPQLVDNPTPTHDHDRDVGASAEAVASYGLSSSRGRRPQVASSYSYRGAEFGPAVEEENGVIDAGGNGSQLTVRSGNTHWDGDDFELAGDTRPQVTAEEIAAGNANDLKVVGIVAALALGLWLLYRKD